MSDLLARLDGTVWDVGGSVLCDFLLAGGLRCGDEPPGPNGIAMLGRWPDELETHAVVGVMEAVGEDPIWDRYASTPPVAQKLAERASPLPLDLAIIQTLQHLQHVCQRPRLHLRVEEERMPVSRARRTPVRAVAELVSHPGDWEHRTLRSIQPSRVLARQSEDEWNLYENRVAARLVDHLLSYTARRLEELRRIKEILDATRDHGEEIRQTSFRRANRIAALWSDTLESKAQEDLLQFATRLELVQRDLQALLASPLYQKVPARHSVAIALKPTNILVNDPHYRKVAALWRAWVKHGHRQPETRQQRSDRRQREGAAWDRFVLHLVIRGLASLGWSSHAETDRRWSLTKPGWCSVLMSVDDLGVVRLTGDRTLCLLPVCADLSAADPVGIQAQLTALDSPTNDVVCAHVGIPVSKVDIDRATGWSFHGRAVMLACSPWGIDSEERMTRLLHGWLGRSASLPYPLTRRVVSLPAWVAHPWFRRHHDLLIAYRAPDTGETRAALTWVENTDRELRAQSANAGRRSVDTSLRDALKSFKTFLADASANLAHLSTCPVCGEHGHFEAREGMRPDGSDATWWARCESCRTEWGTRPCTRCGGKYRALLPHTGLDLPSVVGSVPAFDWPDRVLGRDQWAQPCPLRPNERFRCSNCGACADANCTRCFGS